MPLGGMVGEVTYKGELGEFLPLVRLCENANVGKQTAFGLSQIAVIA